MLLDAPPGGENSKHFLAKLVLEALIHAWMGPLQCEEPRISLEEILQARPASHTLMAHSV